MPKSNLVQKFKLTNLKLKGHDYDGWFLKEELDDVKSIPPLEGYEEEFDDIKPILPLEGDEEEVKEGKGLKILTPNKLLPRLPALLAKIRAGNNSYKLKKEIRQIVYLLYQYNKTIKKLYNNLIKSL